MPSAVLRRLLAGPLACLLAAACAACQAAPDGDDTGSGDTTGTTGEPVPTPDFLNPAVGSFLVGAAQIEPELLVVQDIVPGVTQVLLDGRSLGTLDTANPIGLLTADSLTLTLHGALTLGSHTLQLLTPSADGPLYSAELEMKVEPADPAVTPVWSAALTPDVVATGDRMFVAGLGAAGLLAVISRADPDPEIRLYRAAEGGWSSAEPIAMPLVGHVFSDMPLTPAVSAIATPGPDGAAPTRARVAYSVGLPATQIATRDVQIDPSPIVLDPVVAFDLDQALAGLHVEWATFGRPVVIGDNLVAELHAAPDAEQPHPGDRRLVSSLWRGEELGWTPPQQVGTAAPTDLDALGPAPVLMDISRAPGRTLSVRVGGAFPGVLELRDTGAISLSTPPVNAPLDVRGDIALATVVSSFGSRTVAAVDRHGRVSLGLRETSRGNVPLAASPAAGDLPDAPATGPLAVGVGRGYPFFLVPYGAGAPVHVVASTGELPVVQALADLHCDAVALAITLAGNDPDDAAVPLACLLGGELRLGSVRIDPPAP